MKHYNQLSSSYTQVVIMANTKTTVVKGIMDKLADKSLMTDELEIFFNDELLNAFNNLSVKEEVKPVLKVPKPKRKLTDHNILVSENICYIKMYNAVSHKHAFALASMMSRIERSSVAPSKHEAFKQAACEANQKYQHVVIQCDCVECVKL